jgi:predicted type IV restriction endonuclease
MVGAPPEVLALIEKYRADADYFRSPAFGETATRTEVVNPVLKALGWDTDNRELAGVDREVIQEGTVTVDDSGKAPDYAFVLSRRRVF